MAYVAVKGGERAIRNAHTWLAEERRGDPTVPDLGIDQIREQLGRAIDRVMAESKGGGIAFGVDYPYNLLEAREKQKLPP